VVSPWSAEIRPVGLAACKATVWRYRGQLRVTAVVKATFSFVHGAAMELEEPDEILVDDVHHEGDPARSLWAASDLAPYRLVADVVLVGHAHVGGGGAVRLAVFHDQTIVDKRIAIARDEASGPLPLVYERAFGGPGSDENPVGRGLDGAAMPDLIDPASPGRPIGFGPVAASWPARARLAGAGAGGPERGHVDARGHVVEVPSELEWAYFQAAPAGQTTDFLRGDEWIRLEGMDPELPVLQTRLPGAAAAGRVYGLVEGQGQPLAFHADNLHIDADRGRCSVTWRASFALGDEARLPELAILAGVEIGGHPIRWPESVPIVERAPEPPPPEEDPEFGMATIAFAPPEPAPTPSPEPPARERQPTVLLEWGEQGMVPAPPPPPPPARERQSTMLLEWADGGLPPPAPPPPAHERQSTVLLEWGDGGAPPAAPVPQQRQSTVLLSWAEVPDAPTERLRASEADVAIPDDHPLMGTMALTAEQASTPMPVGSPFRITEPGPSTSPRRVDIPGAPWAATASHAVPEPVGDELTRSVIPSLLMPDDLLDHLPTEKLHVKPRPAPAPEPEPEPVKAPAPEPEPVKVPAPEPAKAPAPVKVPAPVRVPAPPPIDADKGGSADRAWSWASVAEPPRAPPGRPPPPRPIPKPAVKSSLYGKFGPQPKKK
jgi:Uncharacterized protein conserved in bacteria (DUF2169)